MDMMTLHVARALAVGCLMSWPALGFGQARRWVPAAPSVDIVCWQEGRKLTRADFEAPTDPFAESRTELSEAGISVVLAADALTRASASIYEVGDDPDRLTNAIVRVEFYREGSWMAQQPVDGLAKTLAREQLYFDVVELTGRKLRRLYAQAVARGQNLRSPQFEAEVQCVYDEEAAVQEWRRDVNGPDGTPAARQRWNELFFRSMRQLARYKSTENDCLLQRAPTPAAKPTR